MSSGYLPQWAGMKTRASGHLRELAHEHVQVSHHRTSQDRATLERAGECCRLDSQGGSGALHDHTGASSIPASNQTPSMPSLPTVPTSTRERRPIEAISAMNPRVGK
jgi:hypothetical protein